MFTLGKKFSEVCRGNGSRIALQIHVSGRDYSSYTYQQLLDSANKVAAWLISQNVKKQDRVAVILDNSFEWVIIYFGIILSGAVAVPLDPQMGRETIFMLLGDSESKIVFVSRKLKTHFNIISDTLIGLKKIVLVSFPEDEPDAFVFEYRFFNFANVIAQDFPGDISFPAIELDEAASILYTSGTTAVAKGVQLSHRNFSANFLSIAKLNLCSSDDNLLCLLPLFHAYSFMATLIFPLFLGARVTLPASLKSEELLECMRTCGVTILIGVPELFYNLHKGISEKINKLPTVKRFLLRRALNGSSYLREVFKINLSKIILKEIHNRFGDKLRYLISGGARLEPKVAQDLQDLGFTVLEGYGLTETSPIVTFNPVNKPKIGSVGKPISAVEVRIVNPDKAGVGEVAIRGQNVMKGYYKLPEETRKVLQGGWFYSGDLGYLDNEGYLFLTGRSKEVIVLSSGKNIYPEEVEEYYSQSRFIKEICVEGVTQESSVALKAIIVPDFKYFQQKALTDIQGKIKWDLENYSKGLPGYKRILGFIITKDSLPRTRLGKIKRYEVREKYLNELLGEKLEDREYALSVEDERILHSQIGSQVIDFLKKELPKQKINLSDHLELDLGIDSLSKVNLIVGMEERFKVALPDTFLTEISTVKELIENIESAIYVKSADSPHAAMLPWKEILQRKPKEDILNRIEFKPRLSNRILTWAVMKLLFVAFKLFFGLKIKGREFIPEKGPYIFCCNHASYLDAFAVIASVPFSVELSLYFIGAKEIFHHPSVRWAIKIARLIPVDPAAELLTAMEVSGYLLRQRKILCIFPEGQRSIDGKVGEFKKGVGILAEELRVPLVPVAIKGSYQAWPRTVKLPKPHKIEIVFGRPLNYKEFTPTPERKDTLGVNPRSFTKVPTDTTIDNYGFITEKIRGAIINLLNEC